jgi:hypothetical protein
MTNPQDASSSLSALINSLTGQMNQGMNQPQNPMQPIRGLLNRKDMSGNVITGSQPRGLDAWYANNPNARSGEFDPNGKLTQQRAQRNNAIGDMGQRLQYANLLDLFSQMEVSNNQRMKQTSGLDSYGMMGRLAQLFNL